jgi:hypothetical protein
MAKQVGEAKLVGVFDDVLYYEMQGEYYARMHNPVSKKKFWKSKAFEGSRRSCRRLGRGSRLASLVYRSVEGKKHAYSLFCALKTEAIRLLKVGVDEEVVLASLREMAGAVGSAGLRAERKREVCGRPRTPYRISFRAERWRAHRVGRAERGGAGCSEHNRRQPPSPTGLFLPNSRIPSG